MTEDKPTYGPRGAYGPRPGELSRTRAAHQIEVLTSRLIGRLVHGLEIKLAGPASAYAKRTTRELAEMLFSPAMPTREVAAERIAHHLLDAGERTDPAFWATDLGRAVAREVGYYAPLATRAVAEAVLQVSRQAVQQMLVRGELGLPNRLIERESLQLAAMKRWPLDGDVS